MPRFRRGAGGRRRLPVATRGMPDRRRGYVKAAQRPPNGRRGERRTAGEERRDRPTRTASNAAPSAGAGERGHGAFLPPRACVVQRAVWAWTRSSFGVIMPVEAVGVNAWCSVFGAIRRTCFKGSAPERGGKVGRAYRSPGSVSMRFGAKSRGILLDRRVALAVHFTASPSGVKAEGRSRTQACWQDHNICGPGIGCG